MENYHQENAAVDMDFLDDMFSFVSSPPPYHHHRLESTAPTTTTIGVGGDNSFESMKKRSPSTLSSLQEPSSKMAALQQPSFEFTNGDESQSDSLGSSELPLCNAAIALSPTSVLAVSCDSRHAVLNRSQFNTTNSMEIQETGENTNGYIQILNSQSEEISKINSGISASPSPTTGTWSASALIPSDYYQQPVVEVDATPLRVSSPARNYVPSPGSDQEGSSSKRLRITKRMKQMSQVNPEEMCENEPDSEAVRLEERSGNLIVNFKCPYGNGCEIFLCGKKCYYKLN